MVVEDADKQNNIKEYTMQFTQEMMLHSDSGYCMPFEERNGDVQMSLGYGSPGFLSGLLADFRLGACAHAAGELLTDLELILANGFVEILLIGVHDYEIHAAHTGIDHPVDNIITGAAYADDFNFYHAIGHILGHITLPPMYLFAAAGIPLTTIFTHAPSILSLIFYLVNRKSS